MTFVSLFNELFNLFSGCVSEGEDVVNESFAEEPLKRFDLRFLFNSIACGQARQRSSIAKEIW